MRQVPAAKLGEVATFIRGVTFKPEDVLSPSATGSVLCMRTKNVQRNLDLRDVWALDPLLVRRREQFLIEGDTLVSSANSWNLVGKCCWIPKLEQDATFGGFVSVLRADRDQVDARYLYQWFSSDHVQAVVRSFGRQTTNISNLNFERCLELPVPLPPLAIQRKIAEALDQVADMQSRRRETIARLDNLPLDIFLDMFGDPVINPHGWKRVPLTEMCQCVSGGTPSKGEERYWDGTVPWFSAKDLKANDLFDSADHVSEDALDETTLRQFPADTVAIVVRGMILAHTFPVSVLRVPATINQDLKALVPMRPLSAQFLANCLRAQSRHALAQVSAAAHGTTRLDNAGLSQIMVIDPPSDLQEQFAQRVGQAIEVATRHRAHLAALNELFASVQHRAFRSELWSEASA